MILQRSWCSAVTINVVFSVDVLISDLCVCVCREESQRVVDVILSRREEFRVFDTYISEYDRSMSLLEESCRNNPVFATIVKKFEVKHWADSWATWADEGNS